MKPNRSIPESQVIPELAGASISSPPTTYPSGERQYSTQDPFGQRWTF